MKKVINIVLFFITITTLANDGSYLTRGSVIYPTTETKISMDKEVLSFKVQDRVAYVDIQFEFFNPETTDQTLLVGFQAPGAAGDVSDSLANLSQINDFTIVQEGNVLPYQFKAAECEDCPLMDPKDLHFSQFGPGIYVYLFEMTFKPGINRVQHSYNFPASRNVSMDQFYNYILTTGSKWAGGKIKDLTVNIDMGPNQYFYVFDIFGKQAEWSVVGSGKVTNEKFDYTQTDSCRMVRTLNGYLQVKVQDFQPKQNIEFGVISRYGFIVWPVYHVGIKNGYMLSLGRLELDGEYSKEDLRLLRNTIYAQYGYAFKDPQLQKYFSQYGWYMPDPNLKMGDIVLTEKEKAFVEEIRKREK